MVGLKRTIALISVILGSIIFIFFIVLYMKIYYSVKTDKEQLLEDELFHISNQLGRYEFTLEILKERDSIAAQKFEDILYKETE